jgi:hypothetical protein
LCGALTGTEKGESVSGLFAKWLRQTIAAVLFVVGASSTVMAMDPMFVKTFPEKGGLEITLHNDIQSPLYSWPRTLLTYPIDFSHRSCTAEQLNLTDKAGHAVPFQLSEVQKSQDRRLLFAKLNFFSALEPGATHEFNLVIGEPTEKTTEAGIRISQDGKTRVVDTGLLKIRLPQSQTFNANEDVPGPLFALNRGQGWIGMSKIIAGQTHVQRIEATVVESGALFDLYRVTYFFDGGARYEAILKSVLGYPFVEFSERMSGLEPEMGVAVEMDWSGLHPDKRFAANGWNQPADGAPIDKPIDTPGIREEPYWFQADYVEDPSKEMLFHLAAFAGNSVREASPVMSFWEGAVNGQELSVFVPDTKGWDDGQYVVWQPSTRLQVSFRYAGGHLIWHWPLVNGNRKTGIALTATKAGETLTESVREEYQHAAKAVHGSFERNTNYPRSLNQRYGQWLRSWYGALSLDKVKDWSLVYPSSLKRPPAAYLPMPEKISVDTLTPGARPEDLLKFIYTSPLMDYPLGLDLGAMNISHRIIRPIVERYMQLRSQLTEDIRKRMDAVLLLSAYLNAGEDMSPVRVCLTGTPNMSADGFSVPAELAVLYPEHPMSEEWRDQFEKVIQLQAKFYTRPDVGTYQSLGGRWTESLATYNWAYFHPTLFAQVSLTNTDGKNRLANAEMALRGRWMVDELSAPIWNPNSRWRVGRTEKPAQPSPWKPGLSLTSENGFERQYPGHGAHSSGTSDAVPKIISIVAHYLRNYDPLTAEHLLWAYAQRTSTFQVEGDEPYWQQATLKMEQGNGGTNPHLQSEKYTGHGIVLRAGVDTPEELSVHLDQTDQGPNYRWGNNGEGSSGILYFFANGQPWTGHEQENTGDHSNDDATGTTTFAVLHDHTWRSIGENVLDRPMFDLDLAQFGEISARKDHLPYSWPAYRSRSVMLIGTDYFILGDDVTDADIRTETRFTWFTAKDLPFPKIVFLEPLNSRWDHWSQVTTTMSKGFLRDAFGPSIALVTHKKDEVEMEKMRSIPLAFPDLAGLSQYSWERGFDAAKTPGVYFVRTASSHDRVFRSFTPIHYQEKDEEFSGMAGVIRSRSGNITEMALFQGALIAAKGLRIQLSEDAEAGISARIDPSGNIAGIFQTQRATSATLQVSAGDSSALVCYIDGRRAEQSRTADTVTVRLEPGRHQWELTQRAPMPLAPAVLRTENGKGGAMVFFASVAGATQYHLELSSDNAKTWKSVQQGLSSPLHVEGLRVGSKVHVRVIAVTQDGRSVAGPEYPVYASNTPPAAPDGLALELATGKVSASWGEILGASEYRFYRRILGQKNWNMVYRGLNRQFDDLAEGVTPPTYLPGRADNAMRNQTAPVYEYAVTAVDENGESVKSFAVNTDPAGWLSWWPTGVERRFKRQTGFWLPPYVPAAMSPPLFYPTSEK